MRLTADEGARQRPAAADSAGSTARPLAVSTTSMLPRVAFEYGQIWCAALTSSTASTASSIDGSVTARVTASAYPRLSVGISETLASIATSATSIRRRRAAVASALSKQAA